MPDDRVAEAAGDSGVIDKGPEGFADDRAFATDEADHGAYYHEATIEAEDFLNGLTADDVWFGPTESGDWGLWPLTENEEEKS